MMTLLREPDQTGHAVDELNRLIQNNPYFHTGHQLYIKSLQQTDSAKMALQLNKTALNVRNRSVLYNYLNRPSAFRQEPTTQDAPQVVEEVPFVPGGTYIQKPDETQNIGYAGSTEVSLAESSPTALADEWQDEGNQVLIEVKNMSTEQLEEMLRQQIFQISSMQEEEEIEQPAAVAKHGSKQPATQNTSEDLIDFFLLVNPKIIPSNSQYQVDLEAGMKEDNDISTETLADIYASQGHKDKAIEIYQQLILKYPEKSRYFAAQINRL